MAIRLVEDIGAPVIVTAVDLITETAAPRWNEWAAYLLTVGGYLGAVMGWGGPLLKNVGIASFPWGAKKIYERVRGAGGTSRSFAVKRTVTRYPAPATESPFQGVKLT